MAAAAAGRSGDTPRNAVGTAPFELASAALALVDQLNDGVVVADLDGIIRYANDAMSRLLGWDPADLLGRSVVTLVPERLRPVHEAAFARYARTGDEHIIGHPTRVPALTRQGGEQAIELVLSALALDGDQVLIAATLRDVSERVDLERQTALAHHLMRVFLRDLDEDELLAAILAALGQSLELAAVGFWKPDPAGNVLKCASFWRPPHTAESLERFSRGAHFRPGEGLPGRVWATGEPTWVQRLDDEGNFPRRAAALEDHLSSAWAVPVRARGQLVGVLELYVEIERAPDAALLELSGVVGQRMGQAIRAAQLEQERRRLAEQEHAVAAAFRTSLLDVELPAIDGIELGASFHPGSASVVGGDFYDVFRLDDRRGASHWGFAIGDVCGTGPEAAAVTAHVRFAARALMRAGQGLEQIGVHLNDALLERRDRRFCTAVLGWLSASGKRCDVRLVNAGHPCPILRRADGTVAALAANGRLLGAVPQVALSGVEVTLGPGEALLLYTDGVTEARRGGELFGERRLVELVASWDGTSARELADAITTAAGEFAERAISDDVAVLVIQQEQSR